MKYQWRVIWKIKSWILEWMDELNRIHAVQLIQLMKATILDQFG